MKHVLNIAVLTLVSGIAQAEIISQVSDYTWDVHQSNSPTALQFNEFDSMGGTRVLEEVSVSVSSFFSYEVMTENGEDYAVGADEWFLESAVYNNLEFNGVFVPGLGGWGTLVSADMGASDGVAQKGEDTAFWSYKETLEGTRDILPFQTSAFIGNGTIEAEIYPYLSLLLPPPPPYFDIWIINHFHQGSVTLNYEYSSVPAPGSAAIMGLLGLAGVRRRR